MICPKHSLPRLCYNGAKPRLPTSYRHAKSVWTQTPLDDGGLPPTNNFPAIVVQQVRLTEFNSDHYHQDCQLIVVYYCSKFFIQCTTIEIERFISRVTWGAGGMTVRRVSCILTCVTFPTIRFLFRKSFAINYKNLFPGEFEFMSPRLCRDWIGLYMCV